MYLVPCYNLIIPCYSSLNTFITSVQIIAQIAPGYEFLKNNNHHNRTKSNKNKKMHHFVKKFQLYNKFYISVISYIDVKCKYILEITVNTYIL